VKQIKEISLLKPGAEIKFRIENLDDRKPRRENYSAKYLENKKNIYQKLKPTEVK